jgi:hypothetical protein
LLSVDKPQLFSFADKYKITSSDKKLESLQFDLLDKENQKPNYKVTSKQVIKEP